MARFTYYGGGCVCSRDECSEDCATYRSYKPKAITNADRIRAMTDEELAELMFSQGCPASIPANCGGGCVDCWLKWLKQEAEDDKR